MLRAEWPATRTWTAAILAAVFVGLSADSDSNILFQRACELKPMLAICRVSVVKNFEKEETAVSASEVERKTSEEEKKRTELQGEEKEPMEGRTPIQSHNHSILVLISRFCVDEREHFVRQCHGHVEETEMNFCTTYPAACSAGGGAVPVMTYCRGYYKQYPLLCTATELPDDVKMFCYAFEEFCLPDYSTSSAPQLVPDRRDIRRCEDVAEEARSLCNPMPPPSQPIPHFKCTQFLDRCKAFVDWIPRFRYV